MRIILFCLFVIFETISCGKPTIILIHGIGGTQIEGALNRTTSKYEFCAKKTGWFRVWLNFTYDILLQRCFVDNFKLIYDYDTHRMKCQEGVQTRIPGKFGDTDPVEYIEPNLKIASMYLYPLVEYLKLEHDYSKNHDLFALPYDFRRIGDIEYMTEYYNVVTEFIDQIVSKRNEKVLIISHSLGGPVTKEFLVTKAQKWKSTNIYGWYSISGAFGGSVTSIQSLLFGYTLGMPKILYNISLMKELLSSFPSIYYLLPSVDIFDKEKIVVQTESKNYTISTIFKLMREILTPEMYSIYKNVPFIFNTNKPGVPMVCTYGHKVDTTSSIIIHGSLGVKDYTTKVQDGDGTVEIESLDACQKFFEDNDENIEKYMIPHANHNGILSDTRMLSHLSKFIKKYPTSINKSPRIVRLVKP